MRQNDIRATQRKVRTQTRSFYRIQVIEERNSISLRVEGSAKKTAVPTSGVTAFFVEGAGRRGFGVVYLFDAGMGGEHVADGFGVCADAVDARDEVAAVALEEDGVGGPVVVFVVFFPGALEEGVVFGFWVEDETVRR
jgi:hypothetical protein